MAKLKKVLLVAILYCLGLTCVQTNAQTVGSYFSSGGLYYQITSNVYPNFEVKMTSITGNSTNIVIPSKVTYNGDEYTVTSIGYQIGYYGSVTGRTNITIPNTVKYIECGAFHGAFEITLEEGNTNYVMENRCLYNKAKDTLIVHARGMATQDYTLTLPSTVKYISPWAFFRSDNLTSLTLSSSLKYIGDHAFYLSSSLETCIVQEGLDSLCNNAFYGCTKLKEITIPKTVTYLGWEIFTGCDSLKTMYYNAISIDYHTIHPSDRANDFYKSKVVAGNLDKVIIGNEVQKLPNNLFAGCPKITQVNFPASLRSIGAYAFSGCNRITSITFPDSLQTIDNGAFEGVVSVSEITIPAGLTYMGNNAFGNTTSLKTVHWNAKHCNSLGDIYNHSVNWTNVETATIGNDVEVIPWYLFANCNRLKTFTIPEGIDSIGITPLLGCDSLEFVYYNAKNAVYTSDYSNGLARNGKIQNFVIGSNVETIPNYLLSNEKGITSLTFPNSLKKIGDYAFNNCGNLISAPLPDNVTSIGKYAFASTAISEVTIPETVTSIGCAAFAYCPNLTAVEYNPVYVDYNACFEGLGMFDNDTALTNVTISNDVEYIPHYFLRNNKKADITLPDNVRRIGVFAFSGTNIKEVTVSNKVDTLEEGAFSNCDSLQIINYNSPSCTSIMHTYGDPNGVFNQCNNIKTLTIDENVTSLPQRLFKDCYIDTVYAYPLTAPFVGYDRFYRGGTDWIWVPCGSFDSYYNTWTYSTEVLHRLGDTEYTVVNKSICQGDGFEFNGQTLTQSGEYVANLLNKYECDSIVTLNLTVNPSYDTLIESIIQSGDTYTLNGFTQQSEGNYIQNLQTINGCDSIIRLNLTTLKTDTVTLTDTITLTLYDTINTTDTVTLTLYDTINTTDTIVLTLYDTINTIDTITLIQTDTVTLTDTITLTLYDTINTTDTITLTLYDTVTLTDTITLTQTDTVTLTDTITITLYDTVNTIDTVYLHDTITPCGVTRTYIYAEINAGETYNGYGFTESDAGEYTLNLQTDDGCDSIVTLYLQVTAGIEEITQEKIISIYPNPAKDRVTIHADGDIKIIDNKGQIVREIKNIKGVKDINVSDFETGVYYINVGKFTQPLIIE